MRRLSTNLYDKSTKLRGFTIVELLVTITISGMLLAVMFGPLNELYYDNTRGLKSTIKVADTKGALRTIERSISLSSNFYDNNVIADPTGDLWNWQGAGANSRTLITGTYATDIDIGVDASNARTLVKSSGCTQPLLNNVIYFVSGETLYRRTIKNPTLPANTCGNLSIGQKQTCRGNQMHIAACEGTDAVILTGVTNFHIDYYAEPGDNAPLDPGGTPSRTLYSTATSAVPSSATTIVISITARSGPGSVDAVATSKLRIVKVNAPA